MSEAYVPRLKQMYEESVRERLQKEFSIDNVMSIPRLDKVVLNMGVGEASKNIKLLENAVEEMRAIGGQQPVITRAKKSIAAFKLREGMPIGCRVTLRRANMWHFLDRMINVALPRVRDFRGVSKTAFDGRGSYTLGVRDHLIFPEIEQGAIDGARGMNVTIVTTAPNNEQAFFLLKELGMPFRA